MTLGKQAQMHGIQYQDQELDNLHINRQQHTYQSESDAGNVIKIKIPGIRAKGFRTSLPKQKKKH